MHAIPDGFLELLERSYPDIRAWVHQNEAFGNDADHLHRQLPVQIAYPHPLPPEFAAFLYNFFPKIRAWVHKNDELRQELDFGHYRPRLMQVGFSDFLDLERLL